MVATVAFEARDLSFSRGHREILSGVNLTVPYGRVLALVGPNGAGKSTLLSLLSGDLEPNSGEVLLEGRQLKQWGARELAMRRAVLLQSNHLAFSFTAREVVEMGRAPWPADGRDEEIVAKALSDADVEFLQHREYPNLSGGEKARVSLARVLAQDTPIVMLDEPTAALDLRHQEDVLRLARVLAARGRAVVVVLHDLSLAAAYADDVAMISNGRLSAYGSPIEVFVEDRIAEVYETPVRVISDPDTGMPLILPRRVR